uniref:Carboxylic ester hydrolase n=1 Tax=Mola mola TaxID=94237 RepID=A0A3Q3WB44_MOLML
MARVSQISRLFLLSYFLIVSFANEDELLITTKDGQVQGKFLPVVNGSVRAFLGIPFAKPPMGNLRFRVPEPVQPWQGVKDATNYGNTCFQLVDTTFPGFSGAEMWNPNTPVSEDCLYLNIWAPRVNKTQSSLFPVMVWIYGGGFSSGTASLDLYDGRFLAESENVIVASMNYRVGVLGFLSLPDNQNVRGNAGLYDQNLALQWVVNNVAAFGGDPSQVTLFGESAGSASVGLHVLSPVSNSLFQKAVMQSGAPIASWVTINLTEAWNRSTKLGTAVGCSTSDPAKMEACLQQVNVTTIAKAQNGVLTNGALSDIPFLPVIDGVFLPDTVDVMLNNDSLPKKDVLLGLNLDEGSYFLVYGVPGFSISTESLITRDEFLTGVDVILRHAHNVTKETAIFHYTDWKDEKNGTKNRDSLISLLSGFMFFCPVQRFAYRYSEIGGNSFLYVFKHRSSVNPWPEWMGVMHGYEIEFVFGRPLNASLGYTEKEVNMSRRIMQHWGRFARTGNPGFSGDEWPKFHRSTKEYVTLDSSLSERKMRFRASDCQMWTKLIPLISANGFIFCSKFILLFTLFGLLFTF